MGHHNSWGRDFESLFNQHGPQGRRRRRMGRSLGTVGTAIGAPARRPG